MRRTPIVKESYYHIYNRGYGKQDVFLKESDYARFLLALLCFQAPLILPNLNRRLSFVQLPVLNKEGIYLEEVEVREIVLNRFIEVVSFALMPNHFHAIVRPVNNSGVSQHMQRVLNSYTKFFNKKYDRTGHLFQGPYQIVPIETNEQLLYLSAYIHRNPRELRGWDSLEHRYPWSSYQDYLGKNRWGELLKRDIILDQFSTTNEYHDLVKNSGAKELKVVHGLFNTGS